MSDAIAAEKFEVSQFDEAQYWDGRYGESQRMWSGQANVALVRQVAGLTPGHALDLGCGEGADSVWLARQGWRVTGVDVSAVALSRAAEHAVDAGVADQVEWQRRDLSEEFPEGSFDLVSAQFLYSFGTTPREVLLRRAAAAVAPGGVLLIEGHGGVAPWEQEDGNGHDHHRSHAHDHDHDHDNHHVEFPTAAEVLASLKLDMGAWEVLVCEEHERTQSGPDGRPGTRTDNTVKLRRLDAETGDAS